MFACKDIFTIAFKRAGRLYYNSSKNAQARSICRHFCAEFQESVRIFNIKIRGGDSPEEFAEHFCAYIIYDFPKIIKQISNLKIPLPLKVRRLTRRFLTNRI